jgi:hypothetical protein
VLSDDRNIFRLKYLFMSVLWLGTLLPQALDLRSHASTGSDKYGEVVE